jgi:hypothetical protein
LIPEKQAVCSFSIQYISLSLQRSMKNNKFINNEESILLHWVIYLVGLLHQSYDNHKKRTGWNTDGNPSVGDKQ